MNKLFNSIALFFGLLGTPFYLSLFIFENIASLNLQGVTPFALYFANLAGSFLIFAAIILLAVAKSEQAIKSTLIHASIALFSLMAITRLFVFFEAQIFFTFLPDLFAKALMLIEFLSFIFVLILLNRARIKLI